MKTKELMNLLLQGKKIQAGLPGSDYYIYLDKEGNLRNGQGILVELLNLDDKEMRFREYKEKN